MNSETVSKKCNVLLTSKQEALHIFIFFESNRTSVINQITHLFTVPTTLLGQGTADVHNLLYLGMCKDNA